MLKLIKNYCLFLLAPVISVFVLIISYYFSGHFPFGKNSVAHIDMYQQYVPLLYNLRTVIGDWAELFYSARMGGGMNFYGVYNYYIGPASFFALFFEEQNYIYFANILLIAHVALASFFAALSFKYLFKDLNTVIAVMLGIMYGFSGYVMHLYQIISWLCGYMMFPVVMLSLFRLIDKNKYFMFIIAVFISFLMSFYTAVFITCYGLFFSALYIIFISTEKKRAATTLLLSATAALCLSAVVLLPTYYSIKISVRESNITNNILYGNPYGFDYFTGDFNSKIAFLLCCGISLPAILFLPLCIKKQRKKSIFVTLCVLLALLPVFIEPVNVMLHMGSYNYFPLRQGFIPVYSLLMAAALVLNNKYKIKKIGRLPVLIKVIAFSAASVCAVYVAYISYTANLQTHSQNIIDSSMTLMIESEALKGIFVLFLILSAAFGVIMLCVRYKLINITTACLLLCALTVFEAYTNTNMYITPKQMTNEEFARRVVLEEDIENLGDDTFFRIKDYTKTETQNTPSISGNSFSHYTSLTNKHAENSITNLGYTKAWLWISSNNGTMFSDSLLTHKYVVNRWEINNTYLQPINGYSQYNIYQNPYSTDMGIITQNGIFDNDTSQYLSPVEYQNDIFKHYTGQNLFKSYNYSNSYQLGITDGSKINIYRYGNTGILSYNINVDNKETLYFDINFDTDIHLTLPSEEYFAIDVYANGHAVTHDYPNFNYNGIIEIGTFQHQNVAVDIHFKKNIECLNFGLYGIEHDKMDLFAQSVTTAESFEYGSAKYTIKAQGQTGDSMFISVPYDDAFVCLINGKKTEIFNTCGGFMAVNLIEGENNIELIYKPKGLTAGILIFLLGLAIIAFLIFYNKHLSLKTPRTYAAVQKCCTVAYTAAVICATLLIFIYPVCVFLIKLLL